MSVKSNWEIIWDPAPGTPWTVLAYGQEIEAEIAFPWEQKIDERQLLEGSTTDFLPRQLVKGSFELTVWKDDHADLWTAMNYILTTRAGLPTTRKTIKITPKNGTPVNLTNSVLVSAVPQMVVSPEDGKARTSFRYRFAGAW